MAGATAAIMLRGEIEGTAEIIRTLKEGGVRLYALTNFSAETFPIAMARCPTSPSGARARVSSFRPTA